MSAIKKHKQQILLFTSLIATLLMPMPVMAVNAAQKECYQVYNGQQYDKALEICRPLAESGFPQAQVILGTIYERILLYKDNKKAMYWYKLAASQGSVAAQVLLGNLYRIDSSLFSVDYQKSVARFRKAANAHNDEAQFYLGLAYKEGKGVEKNLEHAHSLFLKAALQGHSLAQLYVSADYMNGEGVTQDIKEAFFWLEASVNAGNANAQVNLADLMLSMKPDVASVRGALDLFFRAADQNYAEAAYRLGLLYKEEKFVKSDDIEAAKWFTFAAEQGHIKARTQLTEDKLSSADTNEVQRRIQSYKEGRKKRYPLQDTEVSNACLKAYNSKQYDKALGICQKATQENSARGKTALAMIYSQQSDNDKALELLRDAARDGLPKAQYLMGLAYKDGEFGLEKDSRLSFLWVLQSAKRKHLAAMYSLGLYFLEGYGVEKNAEKAVAWFRKAAMHGYTNAQFNLATLYTTGQGATKDLVEAYFWYTRAEESNHPNATKEKSSLKQHLTPDQIAEVERRAAQWLEEHGKKK